MDGNAKEDASPLRGGGGGGGGVLRSSFRSSMRWVAKKSPLSPKSKGSKVTAKEDKEDHRPPTSPSEYRRRRRQGVRGRGFSCLNENSPGS